MQGPPPQGLNPPQGFIPSHDLPQDPNLSQGPPPPVLPDTHSDHGAVDKSQRTQNQLLVHEAKAIIYTCMDFRLIDDVVLFMNKKGFNNNYDQFILAGASLAFVEERFKP